MKLEVWKVTLLLVLGWGAEEMDVAVKMETAAQRERIVHTTEV